MTRFATVGILVILLPMLMLSCQSAEDRQAAALREFLRGEITKFEPLNQQVIAGKQKLYEIRPASPFADVAETRKKHKEELAELRRQIEEYPNLELPALSANIRAKLQRRQGDVEDAASEVREAQNWARVRSLLKNKEPWRPEIIQGGQPPIEAGKQ